MADKESTVGNVTGQAAAAGAVESAAGMGGSDPKMITAKTNRKHFMEALEGGTLACLPGSDGKADVSAVKNVVNGHKYKGMTTILLKDFARRNGFKENKFMSMAQIDYVNMKKDIPFENRIRIKKGSHGIDIQLYVDKTDEAGNTVRDGSGRPEKETRTMKFFNIAQVENPEKLLEYEREASERRYIYAKAEAEKNGRAWHEANPNKAPKEVSAATTAEPAKFLAEYFYAMEKGRDFAVSKEIAEAFKAKTKEFIYEHKENEPPKQKLNPYNLIRLEGQANRELGALRDARRQEIRTDYARKGYEKRREEFRQKAAMGAARRTRAADDGYGMSM